MRVVEEAQRDSARKAADWKQTQEQQRGEIQRQAQLEVRLGVDGHALALGWRLEPLSRPVLMVLDVHLGPEHLGSSQAGGRKVRVRQHH